MERFLPPRDRNEERVEGGRRKESCSFSSPSGQEEKGGKEYSSSGMLYDLNLHQEEEERVEKLKNGMRGEGKNGKERREEGKKCKEELIGILSRIGISNVSFRSSNHSFPSSIPSSSLSSVPSSSSCVKREETMKEEERKEENESSSQKPETVFKPSS